MNHYLVSIADYRTGKLERIVVRSLCSCHMQEFVDTLGLELETPVVIGIESVQERVAVP